LKKLLFGVIGTGLWGEVHAEIYSFHHPSSLVAVCDENGKRARQIESKYQAKRVYDDYAGLVRDPEVEAVAIVTPDFAHCGPIVVTRQNIEEGKMGNIISAYLRLNDTVHVPTRMLSWVSKSSIPWFLGDTQSTRSATCSRTRSRGCIPCRGPKFFEA
jgi:hypothetical protein